MSPALNVLTLQKVKRGTLWEIWREGKERKTLKLHLVTFATL